MVQLSVKTVSSLWGQINPGQIFVHVTQLQLLPLWMNLLSGDVVCYAVQDGYNF